MRKIQGWKQSLLSQVGIKILIKAVAQAVPIYPMNIFKFPKSICKEFDSMIANSSGIKKMMQGK